MSMTSNLREDGWRLTNGTNPIGRLRNYSTFLFAQIRYFKPALYWSINNCTDFEFQTSDTAERESEPLSLWLHHDDAARCLSRSSFARNKLCPIFDIFAIEIRRQRDHSVFTRSSCQDSLYCSTDREWLYMAKGSLRAFHCARTIEW